MPCHPNSLDGKGGFALRSRPHVRCCDIGTQTRSSHVHHLLCRGRTPGGAVKAETIAAPAKKARKAVQCIMFASSSGSEARVASRCFDQSRYSGPNEKGGITSSSQEIWDLSDPVVLSCCSRLPSVKRTHTANAFLGTFARPAQQVWLPGNDIQDPTTWHAPPLCTLKRLHGDLLQHYDCTEQAAPQPPPPSAGGNAAANAGARPQPSAGSQDNINGTLLLPQPDRLHLAFKRRQVSPSASSSSQDQQAQQPTKSIIPSQHRVTEQLTKHLAPFKALRQRYAGTRFEEQRQLHLPQKYKAMVPDSTLRVEMNNLEEQADNAKARELF